MHLHIIERGYFVDDIVQMDESTVHNSFQSACNIKLQHKDTLVTLLSYEKNEMVPFGLALRVPCDFTFNKYFFKGEKLRVSKTHPHILCNGDVSIDFDENIQVWNKSALQNEDIVRYQKSTFERCVYKSISSQEPKTELAQVFLTLFYHQSFPQQGEFSKEMYSHFLKIMSAMLENYEKGNKTAWIPLLTKMVGVGRGLTPSGDDFIVGFIAGLFLSSFSAHSKTMRMVQQAMHAMLAHESATNLVSKTYMCYALNGHFSRRIKKIITATEEHEIEQNIKNLVKCGGSSGHDFLIGLATQNIFEHKRRTHEIHV